MKGLRDNISLVCVENEYQRYKGLVKTSVSVGLKLGSRNNTRKIKVRRIIHKIIEISVVLTPDLSDFHWLRRPMHGSLHSSNLSHSGTDM